MKIKDLTSNQKSIYNKHYKDLVEPDKIDQEMCIQIALLVDQIETMQDEINNTGLLLKQTGTHGQTITRLNPLQTSMDRTQKTLQAQLKALSTRQDQRKKQIWLEELEEAKRNAGK